jgi:hypothetical protein
MRRLARLLHGSVRAPRIEPKPGWAAGVHIGCICCSWKQLQAVAGAAMARNAATQRELRRLQTPQLLTFGWFLGHWWYPHGSEHGQAPTDGG